MKRIILTGLFLATITTTFAFKVEEKLRKNQYISCSAWNSVATWECDAPLIAASDCTASNKGPQCTTTDINGNTVPAYEYTTQECTYPLYHQF